MSVICSCCGREITGANVVSCGYCCSILCESCAICADMHCPHCSGQLNLSD